MKSPNTRGRGLLKDKDDIDRISSPSSRIVSGKRVNREKEPLLRDSGESSGSSFLKNNRKAVDAEILSLHAHPMESTPMDQSFSIDGPPMRNRKPHYHNSLISEYTPALRKDQPLLSVLLPYYLPILSWIHEYSFSYFMGDLVSGVSLASFQIPLAISYSISLAKLPITCGLYSLGIAPLIYCIFGSVPQMIVGPEAPISLIVGLAVEPLLHHAKKKNLDPVEYLCAITFVSGATLLGFGIARFGFLDNVLSESLLKGFICGVGIVMVINSSVSMLGLSARMEDVINDKDDMDIHSPFDKVRFLWHHFGESHALTMKVSIIGFLVVMSIRVFKARASKLPSPRWRLAIFIPEILIVVLASTLLCYHYRWNRSGLEIVGSLEDVSGGIQFYNPFTSRIWTLIRRLSSSGFTCAMLGFFESTTASKSLGSRYDLPISSNRELVALGAINVAGSFLGALPAFGGYGRSKINAISAKTTVSGAIMGLISLATLHFVLGYLHYIPKSTLSVIAAVIGISLISEVPQELYFHWISKGYDELITFFITVLTTLFFSMEAGIAVGLGYSLLRVIRNSAESRIQILGRVPGTNTFLDADLHLQEFEEGYEDEQPSKASDKNIIPQLNLFTDNFRPLNYHALEEIEGCLIIRIPEPLTFTNASDLRARLKRVEMYGSAKAHPAQKRSRDSSMTKYIIFDLEDMIYLDSSAANILKSWLASHLLKGIRSFFVRVTKTPKLRRRLKDTGIKDILEQDLISMRYDEIRQRDSLPQSLNMNLEDVSISDSEVDEIRAVTEKPGSPYFDHIRSALKLIDAYERLELSTFTEDV